MLPYVLSLTFLSMYMTNHSSWELILNLIEMVGHFSATTLFGLVALTRPAVVVGPRLLELSSNLSSKSCW